MGNGVGLGKVEVAAVLCKWKCQGENCWRSFSTDEGSKGCLTLSLVLQSNRTTTLAPSDRICACAEWDTSLNPRTAEPLVKQFSDRRTGDENIFPFISRKNGKSPYYT